MTKNMNSFSKGHLSDLLCEVVHMLPQVLLQEVNGVTKKILTDFCYCLLVCRHIVSNRRKYGYLNVTFSTRN